MSWKDNLFDASFREVPFKVLKAEYHGGRRYTTRHRYKRSVLVYDLGPYDETFKIEAIITQTYENDYDYFTERDNLIWALSQNGYGELVHPFSGSYKVQVAGDFRMEESFEDGGVAKFEIPFIRVPSDENIKTLTQPFKQLVATEVDNGINLIADYFQQFLSRASFIQSTINDAIAMVNGVKNKVSQVQGAISATISAALGAMTNVVSLVTFAVGTPCDLVELFTDSADQFKNICGLGAEIDFDEALGGCSGKSKSELTGGDTGETESLDGESVPQNLGRSVVQQMVEGALQDNDYLSEQNGQAPETVQLNRDIMLNAMAYNLIGKACEIAMIIEFESEDEMLYIRDLISDAIDTLLLRLGSQEGIDSTVTDDSLVIDNTDAIIAFENLQSVFVKSITQQNSDLNKTIVYTVPPGVKSALELAYEKYRDITRLDEISKRNRKLVSNPGFLPGDTDIKVLEK